jgi:hypothetical protein
VDEPAAVRGIERGRDLRDDAGRALRVERAAVGEHGAQVLAVDEPHHLEEDAVLLPGPVDRNHVRVVERSRGARLGDEAAAERGVVGVGRGDHLHGHGPLEVDVDRPIDDAHASAPGDALDPLAGDHASDEALVHR